jgi:steroid delta-isomerase-like uncharacterized protein
MSTGNKELTTRFMDECWSRGNLDGILDMVSDTCTLHDPVFPSLVAGAESIKRHIMACRKGFPDLWFTIEAKIAERNEVVYHWTARGTHRGTFLGMPPTNKKATVSGTSIFRIENGKIAEQWANWNLMSLMEQLGIAIAPKVQAAPPAHRKTA